MSGKSKKPFAKFKEFQRRVSNKVYFEETTPGTIVLNKLFTQLTECKQSLSNIEFNELQKIVVNKNVDHVIVVASMAKFELANSFLMPHRQSSEYYLLEFVETEG